MQEPPRPRYPKAPVVEAVLDVQVAWPKGFSFESAQAFGKSLVEDFPRTETIGSVRLDMKVGEDGFQAAQLPHESVGVKLWNAAATRVLQAHENGFTYSHLPPYTDWETFVGEARTYWRRYCDMHGEARVRRIAARYINRLTMPSTQFELDDYLAIHPQVPKCFDALTGIVMQVQMPWASGERFNHAIVTLASEQAQSFVLDIDVSANVDLDIRDDAVWAGIESFRAKKNEIFEACIKDSLRDGFKGESK